MTLYRSAGDILVYIIITLFLMSVGDVITRAARLKTQIIANDLKHALEAFSLLALEMN
jgi:hypothetical protein